MNAQPTRAAHGQHWQQSFPNSCVPACLATALLKRGATNPAALEDALHQNSALGGHGLYDPPFLAIPGVRGQNLAVGGAGLDEIRAAIAQPAQVVVMVFGPRWVARIPPGSQSPHGVLCAPGTGTRPYHSVVVVDWYRDSFLLLDPFFSVANQPFEASDDEMLASITGHALVVPF